MIFIIIRVTVALGCVSLDCCHINPLLLFKPSPKEEHDRRLVVVEIKPRKKKGMADILFHFQSVKMRLKAQGQNDCHQSAYISMLSGLAFHSYLALKLSTLLPRVAQVL